MKVNITGGKILSNLHKCSKPVTSSMFCKIYMTHLSVDIKLKNYGDDELINKEVWTFTMTSIKYLCKLSHENI